MQSWCLRREPNDARVVRLEFYPWILFSLLEGHYRASRSLENRLAASFARFVELGSVYRDEPDAICSRDRLNRARLVQGGRDSRPDRADHRAHRRQRRNDSPRKVEHATRRGLGILRSLWMTSHCQLLCPQVPPPCKNVESLRHIPVPKVLRIRVSPIEETEADASSSIRF